MPCWAYLCTMASRAATVEASQMCDRDMSMTTREGSSAYENCVVRSFELAKNSSPSTAYRATDPSSDSVRATVVKCATRRTKRTAAVRIPAPTPTARFSVSTVSATVTSITAVSLFGMRRSVEGRTECQSNAAYDTMSMTATSAAMGIDATKSPNTITSTRRKAPARNVEMRVRAPEILTFIMVCPTTAQPPMPPNRLDRICATPWPAASRDFDDGVSVMSSTSFAVMSDSTSPTTATPAEYGAIVVKVSHVSGTAGSRNPGSVSGSAP